MAFGPNSETPRIGADFQSISPAARAHVAVVYDRESELLDRLVEHAARALRTNGSALIIGTPEHADALQLRLSRCGIDLSRAILEDRYIRLDAETTLARFMIAGRPDSALFHDFVTRAVRRAGASGRYIHAFGAMVALLWERGETGAALELERLWNEALERRPMDLMCAYPRRVLGSHLNGAARLMAACHTQVTGLPNASVA